MTSASLVTVITGRRLLGDAVSATLGNDREGADVELLVVDSTARLPDPLPTRGRLIIDLDSPALSEPELHRVAAHGGWLRRAGFFDAFDAHVAQRAFEVGVTALYPLHAPTAQLVDAVFGMTSTTSTRASGVTHEQLEKLASLTKRELEVLLRLADGESSAYIAVELGISQHTVETHKRRMFSKLDVQSSAHAIARAAAAGLLPP